VRFALAAALVLAACGDDQAMPDAEVDAAPPDACASQSTGMCPLAPVTPPGICPRTFGSSQLVSNDSPQYQQNGETSIAADGQGHVVVAWIASQTHDHIGVSYSDDAGVSFTRGPELGTSNQEHNDPVVLAESDGSFLLVWLGYDDTGGTDHIWAARSTDHGHTFGAQIQVNTSTDRGLDKPWVYQAADAAHTIFVTYDATVGSSQFDYLVSSTDGGMTWSTSLQVSEAAQTTSDLARIATDSTRVYVSYDEAPGTDRGSTMNKVYVRSMMIGGTTFDPAVVASAPGDSVVFDDPPIVATGDGQLTLVYVSGSLDGTTHARVRRSADAGLTWVDDGFADDDGCGSVRHLAELRAGADGRQHVLFYDNRFGSPDGVLWYTHTQSASGMFGANEFVSDHTFTFTSNRMTNLWLGDYVGLTVAGGKIYTSWTDPRNGTSSQVYVASGSP
jgi:hypothetical protein